MSSKKITTLLILGLMAFAAILAIQGLLGLIGDVKEGNEVSETVAPTPVRAQLAGADETQEIEQLLSDLDEDQLRQLQELLGQ